MSHAQRFVDGLLLVLALFGVVSVIGLTAIFPPTLFGLLLLPILAYGLGLWADKHDIEV